MKIRYSNGFSLSLWNNEYRELIVEEDLISYLTNEGLWIKIRIPPTWNQASSLSKTYDGGSSSNKEALGAEMNLDQPPSASLNPSKNSQNERSVTEVKEINIHDEIVKLKQDIEKHLQKDFCPRLEIQPRFKFVADTFKQIEEHVNRLRERVSNIERSSYEDFDGQEYSEIESTPELSDTYTQTHERKQPEIIPAKKKKKK